MHRPEKAVPLGATELGEVSTVTTLATNRAVNRPC
jgi:hypothetical protein